MENSDPDTVGIGPAIKMLRQHKGWSRDVLASKAGVTRQTVFRLEKHTGSAYTGRVDTINKLAGALGAPAEELHRAAALPIVPGGIGAPFLSAGCSACGPGERTRYATNAVAWINGNWWCERCWLKKDGTDSTVRKLVFDAAPKVCDVIFSISPCK